MRVLFVNPGLALGGAEQSLLLLVQELRMRGIGPTVALFGDGPLRDRLSTLGVPVVRVTSPRPIRRTGRYGHGGNAFTLPALAAAALPTAVRLAAVARRAKADLIHTNGMKAHLMAGFGGRLIGVPVVWHLHDFPPRGWAGRVFRGAARSLPRLLLAVSEAVAASVQQPGGVGPDVVRVSTPVDLRRFHPDVPKDRVRRELALRESTPLIGLIAHLTPWKGHELFLAIAHEVARTVGDAHFVIVGGSIYETDGHAGYAEALRRRATELGISDRVTFLGLRDDIPEILAALDVLVHCPTAPEPFGRVLAEAMAVGRPVVAARCGGIPEVVEDQVTGLLVTPGDAQGFASAVLRLLEDPALGERFGKAGRQRAETLCTNDAHVDGVLKAYKIAMTGGGMAA